MLATGHVACWGDWASGLGGVAAVAALALCARCLLVDPRRPGPQRDAARRMEAQVLLHWADLLTVLCVVGRSV